MPADAGTTLALEARAEPGCLDRVHGLVEELWTRAPDVDVPDRYRFETAVIEVAGNIVEHAGPAVRLRLSLSVHPDRVEAQFCDDGRPVDLSTVPDEVDLLAEGGRGVALARAAVDDVDYQRTGSTNSWHVLLRRSAVHPID